MPPLVAVAVKVTDVPEHIVVPGTAAIATLTGRFALTVIVSVFEVAGEPVAQVAFDVSTQVIRFPLVNAAEVYVEFVAPPIFVPLFFH